MNIAPNLTSTPLLPNEIPYFQAYSARALSIQKRSEIVKNEHARYTLERFPNDNARVICTKKVSENTVLCMKMGNGI
jgi:hypothetical protein